MARVGNIEGVIEYTKRQNSHKKQEKGDVKVNGTQLSAREHELWLG